MFNVKYVKACVECWCRRMILASTTARAGWTNGRPRFTAFLQLAISGERLRPSSISSSKSCRQIWRCTMLKSIARAASSPVCVTCIQSRWFMEAVPEIYGASDSDDLDESLQEDAQA